MNVVLGPSTNAMVEDRLATIDLDFIQVKGKTSGTYIYALMGDAELKATPEFINIQDKIHQFMDLYRSQKFDAALELLEEIRILGNDENKPWALEINLDVVYELYETRITEYKEFPPPTDWDGVFIATSK
jgi:adenylate cyclase